MTALPRLLFVIDDTKEETAYRAALHSRYQLEFCYETDDALAAIAAFEPKLVFLHFRQDKVSPLTIAHALRLDPHAPYIGLVYVSQQEANDWLEQAITAGIDVCLPEGRTMPQTITALETVERLCQTKDELAQINARLHKAYGRLQSLSLTDAVTGLGNLRFMNSQLRAEFKRAQRYQKNLVLLLVSIDRLKTLDKLSAMHETVLGKVGQTIGASIRFELDHSGRCQGADFFVILPETDIDGAISVAERIRGKIANLFRSGDEENLSASVGLAYFNGERDNFASVEDMVRTAEEALHTAEQQGGDQYWALDSSEPYVKDRSA